MGLRFEILLLLIIINTSVCEPTVPEAVKIHVLKS